MRPYTSYIDPIMTLEGDYMDEIMGSILDRIRKYTENTLDIESLLASITESTMCVGSGGSRVVATFAKKVLIKKNRCIAEVVDMSSIREYMELYSNIFICSYSGSNFGVRYALDNDINHYLFSSRNTRIGNENLIHYDLDDEKSFISLGATIIPMAILLKYYLGDKFCEVLENIFNNVQKDVDLNIESIVNIFSSDSSMTASVFLESSFIESGLSVALVHDKYDYCHGRSTINKGHGNSGIFFDEDNDIDNILKEVLEDTLKEYIVISSPYSDSIISDFYYTLVSLYLMYNIAKRKNIDLSKIDYDRLAVKRLYHFKGSM